MVKKKRTRIGPTPFSQILRRLMQEKGLSVREAAKMAGVSSSTIDNWRGGALPEDYTAVKRLAERLHVSFAYLLTGENEKRGEGSVPSITEVFEDGGSIFDGYAKITIQRLVPRKNIKASE